MNDYKVFFYKTKRGDYPIKKFMDDQNESTYSKILRSIELIKKHGPFLKPPYAKKIQQNLYELRIQGKEAIRIFYTKTEYTYILLHVFKKKSQKIPDRELKTAVDRLKEIS